MAKYSGHVAAGKMTPQSRKAKSTQVPNHAGGFTFKVDDWNRFDRFLMIGSEKNTYYVPKDEMVFENYEVVKRCMAQDPKRTINRIVEISSSGRAPKNDPAIFSLAVCSVFGDVETKAMANKAMPSVARYSTDMFVWVTDVLNLKKGKKGMGFRRALGRWYTEKDAVELAYQLCKYPSRSLGDGKKIAHADLLRMCRPVKATKGQAGRNGRALTIPSDDHATLFQYSVHGVTSTSQMEARLAEEEKTHQKQEAAGISPQKLVSLKTSPLKYVYAHEKARQATKASELITLIEEFGLTRESVPPQFRNDIDVQRALLHRMPFKALIRNLGGMTSSGLLKELGDETADVVSKLKNRDGLKHARVHPMSILMAWKTYALGHGMRSTWSPIAQIIEALENAFYGSFDFVEPTGKKFLVGCDSSGSMFMEMFSEGHRQLYERYGMVAAEAAACIGMVLARTEDNALLKTFSTGMKNWGVTRTDTLHAVVSKLQRCGGGGTDVSAPMIYAYDNKLDVDTFVILTDSETWAGSMHPHEALNRYRNKFNPKAKMAVLAFTATDVSVADPEDAGMMDFVGLDASIPKLLADFASDRL